MTLGAGLLTLNDAISKHLALTYPVGEIVALRQLAAFLFIVPYALLTAGLGALRPVNYTAQFLRGLLFVASTVLIIISLKLLPLTLVTALLFSSPLFVAILSPALLAERVSPHTWRAIALGFGGVLLIVQPAGDDFTWLGLLPLFTAFVAGLRDTVTRMLSKTESSLALLFWSGVTVMAAGLCTLPWGWVMVDGSGVLWFLVAGFLNSAAHFLIIEAFRLSHAAVVAPFRYTGLLWAMVVGFLAWGEVPGLSMLAGAAVVIAAGVYMLRHPRPAATQ